MQSAIATNTAKEAECDINLTPMLDVVFIMLIAIAENSGIWMDDRLIDPRAVRANIERGRAQNPSATVVIQASKRSSNKALVQVMDASRQAGIYNIALAAERE